jgi:hypothetical protein
MKPKKYLQTGLGMIGGGIMIGAMPNPLGDATVENMKGKAMTGMGNMASTLPAMGSMTGAGMVLGSVKGLQRATRSRRRRRR